jgi:competence protein ComEC
VESISDSSANFAKCSGKILASFELDSNSAKYQYGDLLILNVKISKISGPDNPNSFDAYTFDALGDLYHQAYIKSNKSKILGRNRGFSAQKLLIDWRKYLSSIFERHLNKTPNEKAVAEALVLGVRSDFSPELKNAYADTGATHVLSVSGLHVGLVAGLLGWLIKRSRKRKNDNFSRKEIAILLGFIWFYVLLTGASASVLRSGLMFSFVLLATMLRRKISVYNSLAASAFALLCMQPKFLYDIGFQLSYLALFGIVFFHPHIYRCLFFKNKAANWAWNLTAVGIAAQLVTLPISLYYFHQFPTYFWLSGLAVIPLSTLALYSGIALLVFDWIPFLAYPIAQLTYYSLALMTASIFAIQNLPFAVIGGFWVGIVEMLLLYLFIFSLGITLLKKSLRLSYLSLGIAFTIFLSQSLRLFNASNQEKIVVYKVNKSTLIEFYNGHHSYCLRDSTLSDSRINFLVKNHRAAQRVLFTKNYLLNDSLNLTALYLDNSGIGKFKNFSFAIPPKSILENTENRSSPAKVDFLIIRSNPKLKDLEKLENLFNFRYLVFDASNSSYRISKWKRQCQELSIPYIDCSEKGCEIVSFVQKKRN